MRDYLLYIVVVCGSLLRYSTAKAQYKGGSEDGFTQFTLPRTNTTDIAAFKGGNDDGVAQNQYNKISITDAAAFRGGNEDGFALYFVNKQMITDVTAFKGGDNDGFAISLFSRLQPNDVTAFTGGNEDGFSMAMYNKLSATDNNAFHGGGNDGFTMGIYLKNAALPVTLVTFTGRWHNNTAVLEWQTATEINTHHFILERSFNGNDFTDVATIAAAGNSTTPQNYQYLDEEVTKLNISGNRYYYRLKTVDNDGKKSLSAVIILTRNNDNSFTITLFPNPANNAVHISFEGMQLTTPVTLILRNAQGKIIIQQQTISTSTTVNTYTLLPGWYSISIYQHNQLIRSIPVIIQH